MSVEDARRLGIDYTKCPMARGNTANGAVTLYDQLARERRY